MKANDKSTCTETSHPVQKLPTFYKVFVDVDGEPTPREVCQECGLVVSK